MREITRIHIAKVAYDIEVDAKSDIEMYINALERYAEDPEILVDIEIRITELLAERGVVAGGVIGAADITAIRAQLGEPSDFAASDVGPEAVGDQAELTDEPRRVYRDESEAVLGGVLAGFAKFFGIDPLWVRLLFIVLLFASFGTALIVYLILWLIIPPATTAAEKLRMSGQPVTLAAIKDLVGSDDRRGERGKVVRRMLSSGAGVLLVLLAIGGLVTIAAVLSSFVFGFGIDQSPFSLSYLNGSWWLVAALGLLVLSGVLFSALCFVLASAAFRRYWTKRIGTAVVAIVAAGLVVFVSGASIGMFGYVGEQSRIDSLRATEVVDLSADFMDIDRLIVEANEGADGLGRIEYIVSDKPRFELDSLPDVQPEIEVSEDNTTATVRLVQAGDRVWHSWTGEGGALLRIYGPALDSVEAGNNAGSVRYYSEQSQPSLEVLVRDGSQFNLGGRYETVSIISEIGASSVLDSAAIRRLVVDSRGGVVTAGVVRSLDVTQPDACAARDAYSREYYVYVQAVSSDSLVYNEDKRPVEAISNDCGTVAIGDDDPTEDRSYDNED